MLKGFECLRFLDAYWDTQYEFQILLQILKAFQWLLICLCNLYP